MPQPWRCRIGPPDRRSTVRPARGSHARWPGGCPELLLRTLSTLELDDGNRRPGTIGVSGICAVARRGRARTGIDALLDPMRYRGIDGDDAVRLGGVELGHLHHYTTPEAVGERQPIEVDGVWIALDGRLDDREWLLENWLPAVRPGASDATLVGHAYRKYGIDCLRQLTGAFGLVVWDADRSVLYAARDKTGIRQVYYGRSASGALLIASEVGAILEATETGSLNEGLLGAHLVGEMTRRGDTFYEAIHALEPGTYLVFDDGAVRTRRYWRPGDGGSRWNARGSAEATFYEILRKSVRDRTRGVAAAPLMMSGGVDSTAIAAVLAEDIGSPVDAHSVVFPERPELDEESAVDWMSELQNVTTSKISDAGPLRSEHRRQAVFPDHPCIDSTAFVFDAVLDSLPADEDVLLDGLGGNLFDGNPFALSDFLGDSQFGRLYRTVRDNRLSVSTSLLYAVLPLLDYRTAERVLAGRSYPPWPEWLDDDVPRRTHLADHVRPEPVPYAFHRRSLRKTYRDMTDPYVDFATDGCRRVALRRGVEPRHPLLDARLFDFLFDLDAEHSYVDGRYKQLFRRSVSGVLPERVCSQPVAENTYSDLLQDRLEADVDADELQLDRIEPYLASDPRATYETALDGEPDLAWKLLETAEFLAARGGGS